MLDRIHKISEIVAAFAIVGSLVFVGVQLMLNTSAMDAERRQSAMTAWNNTTLVVAANASLAEQTMQNRYPVYQAFEPSGETERQAGKFRQEMMWTSAVMNTVEHQYLTYLDGNLDEEIWDNYRNVLITNMTLFRGHAQYWIIGENMHSAQFQALYSELMAVAAQRRNSYAKEVGFEEGD
jgi:hypothetical protein